MIARNRAVAHFKIDATNVRRWYSERRERIDIRGLDAKDAAKAKVIKERSARFPIAEKQLGVWMHWLDFCRRTSRRSSRRYAF